MKILVHPALSRSVPSSEAQLSMVRQEVVPTQMTRPPVCFVRLMVSAVSAGIMQYSACISWSVISSSFTGRKVYGAIFVDHLEGDYFSVMGLPLCALARMLAECGVSILREKEAPEG